MSGAVSMAGGTTLAALLRRSFSLYADRVAVTSEQVSRTYREVDERARRLASALHGLGVGPGDRVAVLSETRPEYVETYAALARMGVTVVALNIRMHPVELADCVERSGPVALLYTAAFAASADAMPGALPTLRHRICFDDGYEELLAGASGVVPDVDPAPSDVHNVLFTSGTTGRPKGAMISQSAAAVRALRLAQWFALTPDDGFVGWLPLFHCGGDESLYATLLTGGRYATFPKADVTAMFRLIERDRLSWTLLLPGVLTDYLDSPVRKEHDLSSMRFAIGYANMMPRTIERLTDECGIDFSDAFGQTETSYLLANGWIRPGEKPSLRKQPTPLLEIRLVDAAAENWDGAEVPDGRPGECVVRGPSVMSGYLGDPEATEAAFAGGWLHTGDLLCREPDGTLTFVDRTKYLVKTGGENVYPAEVELVLAEHPAVQESAVFGVPDERWGETVVAVVVNAPGASCTADELVAWCRQRLAGYKVPRYVRFVAPDELPRSTTGKIQRHELAAQGVTDEERV
jgi:acyl-CoA synthetase (AMP-forming)/AMP-acid ligase II